MALARKLLRTALLTVALSSLCVVGASAACEGVGTVTADALRLRECPDTESTILATLAKGDTVVVLDDAGDGWYKVDCQTMSGYMSADYIDLAAQADLDLGLGIVKGVSSSLNVRSGPGTDYDLVASLSCRDVVEVLGVDNGWYKISVQDAVGYVSGDYLELCLDEDGTRLDTEANTDLEAQIVAYAESFLGVPYVYGGNGPKVFDCSGFTKYVYAHFGYELNRTARTQRSNGIVVDTWSELRPGDILFFHTQSGYSVSHVGIYIGNGQFIHASSGEGKVTISELFTGYFSRSDVYVTARRII